MVDGPVSANVLTVSQVVVSVVRGAIAGSR
jgi:hypothetical protein